MLVEAISGDVLGLVADCRVSAVGKEVGARGLGRIQDRGEIFRLMDERSPEVVGFRIDPGIEDQPVTRPGQFNREAKAQVKGTTRWVIPDGGRLTQFHNSKS